MSQPQRRAQAACIPVLSVSSSVEKLGWQFCRSLDELELIKTSKRLMSLAQSFVNGLVFSGFFFFFELSLSTLVTGLSPV